MVGDLKEAHEGSVRLPDNDPKVFRVYVHWLYLGTILVFCNAPDLFEDRGYADLIKIYVLDDKLLDCKFRSTVIDAIVEKSCSKAQDGDF